MKFISVCIVAFCFAQVLRAQQSEPIITKQEQFYKEQLQNQIAEKLSKIDWHHANKTTTGSGALYTIPMVVHILHNYGSEWIDDTAIYNMIDKVNSYLLKTNPDTTNIIDKYKHLAVSTRIALKLAVVDPNGLPTTGIDRIRTYLTYSANDQSKLNQWPQDKYLNCWLVNGLESPGFAMPVPIGSSTSPYMAAANPLYDGIVLNDMYYSDPTLLALYFVRYLNLPFACNIYSAGSCSDEDLIADTPPCDGSVFYNTSNLYDTTCDTANTQNFMMPVSNVRKMFTYGQAQYMQTVLQLNFGKRDSLVSSHNYTATGMQLPAADIKPVAAYSVENYPSNSHFNLNGFFMQGQQLKFRNRSWNDTLTNVSWTFSNGASVPSSTSDSTVVNSFSTPGWVTVGLSVTGNLTGTTTIADGQSVYIGDTAAVPAVGYFQEFEPSGDIAKWPVFNYFNNSFKWQPVNTGLYDHACLEYTGYDMRTYPENTSGTPRGDYDDFFSPVFDLSGLTGNYYLNFVTSGASGAFYSPIKYQDTLEIDYSANLTSSWQILKIISGPALLNKGNMATPYAPMSIADWVPRSIPLPAGARKRQTIFRFRYRPGMDSLGYSAGNNFYLDRINFGAFPEAINTWAPTDEDVRVGPNPTTGDIYILFGQKFANSQVSVCVTDLAGREIYRVLDPGVRSVSKIEIPGNVFPTKGLYIVHIICNSTCFTQKLLVE